jgi:hypothetical protein
MTDELYPPTRPFPSTTQLISDTDTAAEALRAAAATAQHCITAAVSGVREQAATAIDDIESHFVKIESALVTLRAIARAARRVSLKEPPHGAT